MKKIIAGLFALFIVSGLSGQIWERQDRNVSFEKGVRFRGDISPTALSTSVNDYAPTGLSNASVIRLSASAAYNVTGLTDGFDGRIITIINSGTFVITLKDESASSVAANRFAFNADFALQPEEGVVIIYDATSSRWRQLSSNQCKGEILIGSLTTANLNITTDQTIPIKAASYIITKIVVTNASANISAGSTAGGVYPSASKAGTAIVANSQVYTALSAATKYQSLTLASVTNTDVYSGSSIYFSLTTGFGSACTADIYVYGYVLAR